MQIRLRPYSPGLRPEAKSVVGKTKSDALPLSFPEGVTTDGIPNAECIV